MEKYLICSKQFHSGKPAKPFDHTNVDWVLRFILGMRNGISKVLRLSSHKFNELTELRKGTKKRLEEEKEQQMFCEVMSAAWLMKLLLR